MSKAISHEERFFQKVNKSGSKAYPDCWIWSAAPLRGGYGAFKVNGRQERAHRYSFFLSNGFYPPVVMHSCDNPPCVNPLHLTDGTQALNVADCIKKGRFVKAQTLKTHCPKGHEYNSANTYMHGNNRQCRACRRLKSSAWSRMLREKKYKNKD